MNDPVTLLQMVIGLLCAAVPPSAIAGAALWRLSRVEDDVKNAAAKVAEHGEKLVAVERDAHAARNREQAMMAQLALTDEKVDGIREIVIRIDERLTRDDTAPRKRG